MKNGSAIILSSIILAISLIFCTYKITDKMYPPAHFPSSLAVTSHDGDKNLSSSSDFISFFEAAQYLRLDEAKLATIINSGKLNGTFSIYQNNGNTNYIFSSSKLEEVMKKYIEKGEVFD